jgi:hypothetical protein
MSPTRLSVKKAAHADMSRAAYRKSGAVLGNLDLTQMPTVMIKTNPILLTAEAVP